MAKDDTQKKIETFFLGYPQIALAEKTLLVRAEESISFIYYLEEGLVRQFTTTEHGEDITFHLYRPGSYFPIMLAISQKENRYNFEAISLGLVRKAPLKDVLQFIQQDTNVLFDLVKRLSEGMTGLLIKLESEMFHQSSEKVASLLLYLTQKFGKRDKNQTTISLPLTHSDLASWLGLQRETVSRQLEKLQEKGIIANEKHHIVIEHLDLLQKAAGR